jgi:hypothetical protein
MLPFVVQPRRSIRRIGTDESTGALEFQVYGHLLARERADIDELDMTPRIYANLKELALLLMDREGLDQDAAAAAAIRFLGAHLGIPLAMTAEDRAIEARHHAVITGMRMELQIHERLYETRMVTALIRHRLPGCEAWTDDDTGAELITPLYDGILALAKEELNKGQKVPTYEEAGKQMEEMLGKFLLASGSPSPSTGAPDTGAVASSGPATPTSPPNASAASPRPTSKKRLSAAKRP